jgi:hypothetical protein
MQNEQRFLHLEIRTRLPAVLRPPAALGHSQLRMGECVIHIEPSERDEACGLLGKLRYQRFMTVADHGMHSGQRRQFLRRALCITSCDQDARGGVFPVHFAQERARSAVGLRGHAAGVGHNHVSLGGGLSRGQAPIAQIGADDFAVCPASPTSEVLNVIFCHVVSLTNPALFQIGSDQATSFPLGPAVNEPWSLSP